MLHPELTAALARAHRDDLQRTAQARRLARAARTRGAAEAGRPVAEHWYTSHSDISVTQVYAGQCSPRPQASRWTAILRWALRRVRRPAPVPQPGGTP